MIGLSLTSGGGSTAAFAHIRASASSDSHIHEWAVDMLGGGFSDRDLDEIGPVVAGARNGEAPAGSEEEADVRRWIEPGLVVDARRKLVVSDGRR